MSDEAAITDAELEATKREIAALQSELAANGIATEPQPQPEATMMEPQPETEDDFSWVNSEACTEERRIGEGAGCRGVYKVQHPSKRPANSPALRCSLMVLPVRG